MVNTSIRKKCRKLAELILAEQVLDANALLAKIVKEAEDAREERICKIVLEQDDSDSDAESDSPEGDSTDLDDADGGEESLGNTLDPDEDMDEEGDEAGGAEGDGEGIEDTETADGAAVSELAAYNVKISCEVNAEMIQMIADKLSNLKTKLNALGLDKKTREYVTINTTISYYSKKLRELEDRCEETTDQAELGTLIDGIDAAIESIESDMQSLTGEGDLPEVKSTDELAEDEESEGEDEGESEESEDEESEDEGEGGESEAEAEESEGEDEGEEAEEEDEE